MIEVNAAGALEVPAGTGNSVATPAVVIRPILPGTPVNQSAPSGPTVIAVRVASVPAVPGADPTGGGISGTANSVTTPDVVIRPISPGTPVNHKAPSGPAVIPVAVAGVLAVPGDDPAGGGTAGRGYSVTTPAVVIRPISPGMPVNQSAPSGPVVIAVGWGVVAAVPAGDPAGGGTEGKANWVTTPAGVMPPIWPDAFSANQRLPSEPVVIPSGCTISTRGIWKFVTVRDSRVPRLEPRRIGGTHPEQPVPLRLAGIVPARTLFIITLAKDGHRTSLSQFWGSGFSASPFLI